MMSGCHLPRPLSKRDLPAASRLLAQHFAIALQRERREPARRARPPHGRVRRVGVPLSAGPSPTERLPRASPAT